MLVDRDEILKRIRMGGYPKSTRDKIRSFHQSVIIGDVMEKESNGDKHLRSWSLQVIRSLRGSRISSKAR